MGSVVVRNAVEPSMELSGRETGPPIFMTEAVLGMPPMVSGRSVRAWTGNYRNMRA